MPKFKQFLNRLLWGFVYLLPVVLFFSYHPIISLGSSDSMNFELSLPLIWLVLFDIVAFLHLITLKGNNADTSKEPNSGSERRRVYRGSGVTTRISATAPQRRAPATRLGKHDGRSLPGINFPGISDKKIFLFSLFPFFATLSIFWSMNPIRAILTSGIIWLLFFAVFSIVYLLPLCDRPAHFRTKILTIYFISTSIICLFCFLQSILDTCGFSRESTLLCAGCTYRSFGFPHPSGFAIEPQFMGNLLLAPTLLSLFLLMNRSSKKKAKTEDAVRQGGDKLSEPSREERAATTERAPRKDGRANGAKKDRDRFASKYRCLTMFSLLFCVTLFFTFSRGAIYAFAVGLLILFAFTIKRHAFRSSLLIIPITAFLISLGLQGTFAALGPTSETFSSAITKSIHHLSLGKIDLRHLTQNTLQSSPEPLEGLSDPGPSSDQALAVPAPESSLNAIKDDFQLVKKSEDLPLEALIGPTIAPEEPFFDGYVAESTNVRLNLNTAALDTWLSAPGHPESNISISLKCSASDPCTATGHLTPTSVLFGVGLGAAGTAMYRNSFITGITSPKEIVQNEYLSILLELGLVGAVLALLSLLIAFFPQIFPRKFLDGRSATYTEKSQKTKSPSPQNKTTSVDAPQISAVTTVITPEAIKILLVPIIVAFLVSLNFFSGLPNALHIYLLPPLLYLIFTSVNKNSAE